MTPHRIAAPDGFVAVRIAAGFRASFAVTDSGLLFNWGHHYTGHTIETHALEPRQVASLTGAVVDVTASGSHVMAVGTEWQLWAFGDNEWGQLGTGDQEVRRSPHLVTSFPPGERVVQAAAGCGHSLGLMQSGAVYSWGHGGFGQLGHGDEEGQLLPRRIEALAGERVGWVNANRWGGGISAVTTSEGAVLMFGRGQRRALGLEDEENRNLPTRVAALGTGVPVADMAIGGDSIDAEGWSVIAIKGGGILGESLYRWGYLHYLNGVNPEEEVVEGATEGSSVVVWPLAS